MSTPAGRWSSRCSESTVFGVGCRMSISRLWVRISKCSRESLSLNGLRITQYTFFSVGSGTGPDTVAPVRCAVSTISRAARSIASWSYALRRILILVAASEANFLCASLSFSSRERGAAPFAVGPRPGRIRNFLKKGPVLVDRPRGVLLDDVRDDPRADGATALADRESQALVHGDRSDELDLHLDVVSRHHHLGGLGEVGVQSLGELEDRLLRLLITFERLQRRTLDDRRLIARELVLVEQVLDL